MCVCVCVPGEAHDHGHDDSNLNSSDDGGDEDVVQLLPAGHHVQDVEVQQLLTLLPPVRILTPVNTDQDFRVDRKTLNL